MPRSGGFLGFLADDNKITDNRQIDCFTPCVLSYLPISAFSVFIDPFCHKMQWFSYLLVKYACI